MFQRIKFEWVVIVIILAIFVFRECSRPLPVDPSADIYADSIKELKSQKAQISSRMEDLQIYAANKAIQDSIQLRAQEREISRLKIKASKAVEAIPVRVLEENPEIMVAIQAKDSVITKQGQAIDSLKASLAFQIKVKEDLMSDHYNADKINAQLQEMAEVRIVKLERDLKKERRRGRFKAVLIPIVGVAGLLLGSAL